MSKRGEHFVFNQLCCCVVFWSHKPHVRYYAHCILCEMLQGAVGGGLFPFLDLFVAVSYLVSIFHNVRVFHYIHIWCFVYEVEIYLDISGLNLCVQHYLSWIWCLLGQLFLLHRMLIALCIIWQLTPWSPVFWLDSYPYSNLYSRLVSITIIFYSTGDIQVLVSII